MSLTAWYDYESDQVVIHTHDGPGDRRAMMIPVDKADEVGCAIIRLGHERNDPGQPIEIPARFGLTDEGDGDVP